MPKLSDKFGRKPIVMFGTVLAAISCGICLKSDDIKMLYASQFIMGFSMSGRFHVGYVYFAEHWAKEDSPMYTGILFAFDALCLAFCSLFIKYASKDWRYVSGLPMALTVLAYIPLMM